MGRAGSMEFNDLKEFGKRLEKMTIQYDEFCKLLTKELSARLLAKVIKRTPVGDYSETNTPWKMGGTLRRGWTGGQNRNVNQYLNAISVQRLGSTYIITIVNPVKYGIYVEFGHRQLPGRYVPAIGKRLKKSWVEGRFMLTISEMELKQQGPRIIDKKVKEFLKEMYK